MQNKFKNLKILVLAKYYFIGIILGVFVFQFVSISLTNRTLEFGALIDKETLKLPIAILFGALIAAQFYVWMKMSSGNNGYAERKLWFYIKTNSIGWFRIRFMISVSLGILVYINMDHVLDAEEFNLIGKAIFSEENLIKCISGVFGASVFGWILSAGVYKRLRLLFESEEE